MTTDLKKSALSQPRQRLVEMLQRIAFGGVERLVVRDGDPVLSPRPRIFRDIRLGAGNGPARMPATGDFVLKAQLVDLFRIFDQKRSFAIDRLDVQDGIPVRMFVEEVTQA